MSNSFVSAFRGILANQGLTDDRSDDQITLEEGQRAAQTAPAAFAKYPDFAAEYKKLSAPDVTSSTGAIPSNPATPDPFAGNDPETILKLNKEIADIGSAIAAPNASDKVRESLQAKQDKLYDQFDTKFSALDPEMQGQVSTALDRQKTTATGSFLRAAGMNVSPTLGALGGAEGGAAIGTAITPGIGTAIGGAVGALVGGILADKAQRAAFKAVAPKEYALLEQYQSEDWDQHPIWQTVGGLVPVAGVFKVQNPMGVLRGAAGLAKLATGQITTAAEKEAAMGLATQVGMGTGMGAVSPLLEGKAPTLEGLTESTAQILFFGGPRFGKGEVAPVEAKSQEPSPADIATGAQSRRNTAQNMFVPPAAPEPRELNLGQQLVQLSPEERTAREAQLAATPTPSPQETQELQLLRQIPGRIAPPEAAPTAPGVVAPVEPAPTGQNLPSAPATQEVATTPAAQPVAATPPPAPAVEIKSAPLDRINAASKILNQFSSQFPEADRTAAREALAKIATPGGVNEANLSAFEAETKKLQDAMPQLAAAKNLAVETAKTQKAQAAASAKAAREAAVTKRATDRAAQAALRDEQKAFVSDPAGVIAKLESQRATDAAAGKDVTDLDTRLAGYKEQFGKLNTALPTKAPETAVVPPPEAAAPAEPVKAPLEDRLRAALAPEKPTFTAGPVDPQSVDLRAGEPFKDARTLKASGALDDAGDTKHNVSTTRVAIVVRGPDGKVIVAGVLPNGRATTTVEGQKIRGVLVQGMGTTAEGKKVITAGGKSPAHLDDVVAAGMEPIAVLHFNTDPGTIYQEFPNEAAFDAAWGKTEKAPAARPRAAITSAQGKMESEISRLGARIQADRDGTHTLDEQARAATLDAFSKATNKLDRFLAKSQPQVIEGAPPADTVEEPAIPADQPAPPSAAPAAEATPLKLGDIPQKGDFLRMGPDAAGKFSDIPIPDANLNGKPIKQEGVGKVFRPAPGAPPVAPPVANMQDRLAGFGKPLDYSENKPKFREDDDSDMHLAYAMNAKKLAPADIESFIAIAKARNAPSGTIKYLEDLLTWHRMRDQASELARQEEEFTRPRMFAWHNGERSKLYVPRGENENLRQYWDRIRSLPEIASIRKRWEDMTDLLTDFSQRSFGEGSGRPGYATSMYDLTGIFELAGDPDMGDPGLGLKNGQLLANEFAAAWERNHTDWKKYDTAFRSEPSAPVLADRTNESLAVAQRLRNVGIKTDVIFRDVLRQQTGNAKAVGVTYDPWHVAIGLNDITNATFDDFVTLLHEAGHALFGQANPAMQDSLTAAVTRSVGNFDLSKGAEEGLVERLAQNLAAEGIPESPSLAQGIVRWVKDLYYRTAMALQKSVGMQPSDRLALGWFENQLRRVAGGDYDLRFAHLLEITTPPPAEDQGARAGVKGDAIVDFLDPVSGKMRQPVGDNGTIDGVDWNIKTQVQLKPEPQWQVTIQKSDDDIPGYIQIDKIDAAGNNTESVSPEQLAAEGYQLPDLKNVPEGKHTFAELAGLKFREGEQDMSPDESYTRIIAASINEHRPMLESIQALAPKMEWAKLWKIIGTTKDVPQTILDHLESRSPGTRDAKIGDDKMTKAMNEQARQEAMAWLLGAERAMTKRRANNIEASAKAGEKWLADAKNHTRIEDDFRNSQAHVDILSEKLKQSVKDLVGGIRLGQDTAFAAGKLAEAVRTFEKLKADDQIPIEYQNVFKNILDGKVRIFDYLSGIANLDLNLKQMPTSAVIDEITKSTDPRLQELAKNKPLMVALSVLAKTNARQMDLIQLGHLKDSAQLNAIVADLKKIRESTTNQLDGLIGTIDERDAANGLAARLKLGYLTSRRDLRRSERTIQEAEGRIKIIDGALGLVSAKKTDLEGAGVGAFSEWHPYDGAEWTAMVNGKPQTRTLTFNDDGTIADHEAVNHSLVENRSWLEENQDRTGTRDYELVKRQTQELQGIDFERQLSASQRNIGDKLVNPLGIKFASTGTQEGLELQRMLNRKQFIEKSYWERDLHPLANRWTYALRKVEDSAGVKASGHEYFFRQIMDQVKYLIEHEPGREETGAIREAIRAARRRLDPTKIGKTFDEDMRNFLIADKAAFTRMMEIARESGLAVSDPRLGGALRNAVAQGWSTGTRRLRGETFTTVTHDMQKAGWAYEMPTKKITEPLTMRPEDAGFESRETFDKEYESNHVEGEARDDFLRRIYCQGQPASNRNTFSARQ